MKKKLWCNVEKGILIQFEVSITYDIQSIQENIKIEKFIYFFNLTALIVKQ